MAELDHHHSDNEEVTNEAKLQIAQYFLLSSPPGEFNEVLSDVRKLLPESTLSESLAAGIARAYNIKNGKIVTTPTGYKVPLCSASEIDPTHYVDPNTSKVFGVDHLSLATGIDARTGNSESPLENERSAIQTVMNAYIGQKYQTTDAAAGAYLSDNGIVIMVCGEKPNLRNFWSGKFHSSWHVVPTAGMATISGEIKVHAHYFEDGNVQLQSTKTIPITSVTYTSASHLADLISEHINASETALQNGLEEMYANMNEETFKAMRRIMPITKTKMEWNLSSTCCTATSCLLRVQQLGVHVFFNSIFTILVMMRQKETATKRNSIGRSSVRVARLELSVQALRVPVECRETTFR
eukprot:gene13122-27728_t